MPLSAGTKLGPYEILAPLGAGGMGEVYRARDTRLNRDVALKVLPDDFARDPARRQRFEQEARAVAALNHPNIVAVYDVGENFLVSELVDGQTLRALGKLSQRQAIDLAAQIAEGLAAAHAAGIAHRDLKPENIMVTGPSTRDAGRAKILDFGLAKVTQAQASGTEAPTQTQDGIVMGTVGYMSPEQVKGQPADHRSDIFSFGLVLYEMLAARRAFTGGSSIEVMSAILKEDPPELPESIAPSLRRIVEHCLDKNPDRRFQSARDLAFALQAPPSSGTHAVPVLPSRRSKLGLMVAAAVLVTAAVAIAATRLLWPTPAPPSWTGGILGGPEMALNPRLSPDGSLLAFQAMVDGITQVAVMKPETGNWSILTHNRESGMISALAWSRDGASIYYDRWTDVPRGVYSVPLLGGDEHLVLESSGFPEPLPDGSLLAVRINAERKQQLFRFWPDSGRLYDLPVTITIGNLNNYVSEFPTGKQAVVFGARLGQENQGQVLLVLDLETGASRPLLPASAPESASSTFVVTRDGRSVLAAAPAGSLVRIVSIPMNGRTPPQTLFTVANQVWFLDSAPDGSVYMSLTDRPMELVRRPLAGGQSQRIASFPEQPPLDIIAVLPDGRAVLTARTGGRTRLVVVDQGKDPVPLTSAAEETSAPMAVAGPREIAFVIGPAPHQTIAVADTANGRITRRIPLNKGEITSLASSPDGKTLYAAAGGTIWALSSSGGEPRMIRAGDSVVVDPSGRDLVISAMESSKLRLFRVPAVSGVVSKVVSKVEGGSEQEIVTDGSLPLMGFSLSPNALGADGRLLHPLSTRDSWFNAPGLLDTATGRITRIASDDLSDYQSMAWLPDGRIVALHVGLRSTLWKFQPSSR
jgi:Tol biopolymer transport system component/predicted Ser/Thr protein kinase